VCRVGGQYENWMVQASFLDSICSEVVLDGYVLFRREPQYRSDRVHRGVMIGKPGRTVRGSF
jgi:hypothetical protein